MKYPDITKPYTIFTDGSKYGWAGALTQEHTSVVDGKEVTTNHPVFFVSGMFQGSQLNWAAMVKEAYTIYMMVKKSTFYLTGQKLHYRVIICLSRISLTIDRLGFAGYQTYTVRELNVVSERLFIQPMLWGNWLYMLWAGVPATRVCLAV